MRYTNQITREARKNLSVFLLLFFRFSSVFLPEQMSLKEKELYEFGEFRLDVAEHFLARLSGGERVELSEKAFETLCVLVRNAGHLVRKDELMNQIWADSFVEENNLDKCIYAIRRALGEKPGAQKYIETVRKHGYRLIVEVRRVEEDSETERRSDGVTVRQGDGEREINLETDSFSPTLLVAQSLSRSVAPSHNVIALADWRHETDKNQPEESTGHAAKLELVPTKPVIVNNPKYRALVLAALILGVIGLGYYFFSASKTASGADGKKSIAILPVQPLTAENRDVIYEFGIADSLILKLSAAKNLIVRQLSATRKYADIEQDAIAAGREQQVDYVLASNYQIADGKIRVTSQLFNVATGQAEETYKSEKETSNIFATQDAIAGEVGNILLARFSATEIGSLAKRGTTNEEAYRLYLQGMILYDQRGRRNVKKAFENFEQAVKLDPNYALAWAGIARTHQEYQKSIEAANKALALDPNLSEGHSALCANKLTYEYDFAGAERACRRALELDPNSPVAHNIYASFLTSRGQFDEAIAEIRTAIDLDPTSYFNQRVYANVLYFARRYEEAVAQYKRMVEMDEEAAPSYEWLVRTLEAQGNESEAFEWFLKSLTLRKTDNETIQRFKTAYQKSGWQGVLLERDRAENGNYFRRAGVNARLGNKDKAFEYLEKSYQEHEWLIPFLQVEPQLDSLRDDPRFDELVRRVGLK